MSVPGQVFKTHLDSADDDPSQARAQLSAAIDAINQFRTHFLGSPLTSGSSVVSPSGGLAISGSDLLTSFGFAAKTANYTAVADDRGKVINFTTAGVTLSLTAAGTLGDGWWCAVVNSASSGVVTIDPNGSETIDGATAITLLPGEACFIFCNGTLFRTVGRRPQADYFHAHKNGTDQGSIANAAETKVTFGTELADTASVYDTSTSRFTPPSGTRWLISAVVNLTNGGSADQVVAVVLYKNGSAFKRGGINTLSVALQQHGGDLPPVIVEGNGTDFYEIYVSLTNATGSRTVEGNADQTWFQAVRIS